MLDVEGGAQRVELVRAGRGTLAQAEKAVGELLAIIRKNCADAQRASAFEITKEAAGIGRCLGFEYADEDPTRCPVYCHKEVTPGAFIGHLRQVFHVDMDVAGLIGLEGVFDTLCAALDIEHRLTPPKSPQTNGMVERFNGRIEEVLQSHHFRSGEELETTLHRYVWLYNQQLPQSALGSKTPLQAMKDWHKLKPELFKKQPYYLPGCDS